MIYGKNKSPYDLLIQYAEDITEISCFRTFRAIVNLFFTFLNILFFSNYFHTSFIKYNFLTLSLKAHPLSHTQAMT